MKKLFSTLKTHLKSIIYGLICIIIIISSSFAVKKIKQPSVSIGAKGDILELWHIDSFEGGKGSRKDFLLSSALQFEKNHNVIVSVISHTISSAEIALKTRQPDMISCGNGLDVSSFVKSLPFSSQDKVANIDKKSYGVSWCRGGYAFIGEKSQKNLIVSQSEYTLPLLALKQSGEKFDKIEVLPPQKAYEKYLRGGTILLGTQRDIIRLEKRGEEVKYTPISCFCDLYQVICITSNYTEKIKYCEQFISFLLSPQSQKALENIGMLSTMGEQNYKSETLQELQNAKIKNTQSFFTEPTLIKNINFTLQEELKTC